MYLCQKFRKSFVWYFLSVQPIVILAALRSINVGYDTHVYVFSTFEDALAYKSLSDYLESTYFAFGYLFVNYIVSRITNDVHLYLYVIHSIMYGTIAYALYRHKDNLPIWIGLFVLCFVFYRESLNTAKQFAGLCFCFLAFSYMLDKKWFKVAICILIGFSFHHSCLIFVVVPTLYFFIIRLKTLFDTKLVKIVFVVLLVTILLSFAEIVGELIGLGLSDERFLGYTDDSSFESNFPLSQVSLYWFELILFYIWIHLKRINKGVDVLMFEYLFVICSLLCMSALISKYTIRIMSNFSYMIMIIIPFIYTKYSKSLKVCQICFLIFYWFMTVVVANLSSTYPYEFYINSTPNVY